MPLVVGFGISRADHVREVGRYAAGAIVASALINVIEQSPPSEYVAHAVDFVRSLRA
jgi:tryptophan synthase alpha chain